MSLRQKTLLLTGLALTVLVLTLSLTASSFLLKGFGALERSDIIRDIGRAEHVLEQEVAHMTAMVHDWAVWDNTYDFMAETGDEEYRAANLTADVHESLRLDHILYFDEQRHLVCGTAYDAGRQQMTDVAGDTVEWLLSDRATLLGHLDDPPRSGLWLSPQGPLLIATERVLRSDESGPARGTLAFVRHLDAAAVQRLSDIAEMNLSIAPLTPAQRADYSKLGTRPPVSIAALDDQGLRAGTTLNDLAGAPCVQLILTKSRDIHELALATLSHSLATLIGTGVLLAFVALYFLERVVLARVSALTAQVRSIDASQRSGQRVQISGHDELATLGRSINGMLGSLHRARMELEAQQQQLRAQQRELVTTNEELTDATQRADAANRSKSEFLAHMSHEIRTPMTAILGFLDIVATSCPGACDYASTLATDHLGVVRRNADYLLQIINDVLDLSKIEAGRLQISTEACAPTQVLDDVASLLRVRADAKQLSFHIQYDGPIPATIQTDEVRVRQALINVLGNAFKFTDYGNVRLVVRFKRADADRPDRLEFDIIDTGRGMTEAQAQRLFQPFAQADASITRQFGGTGLGLAISKRLAQLLGGDLELVQTAPGVGTEFRFWVPIGSLEAVHLVSASTPPDRDRATTTTVAEPPATSLACRVLLAEDGPDNQYLIGHFLRRAGATVEVVGDGKQAVDAALAARDSGAPFAVILMDMQMPELDGYAAATLLRERGYVGPIIGLTAHAMSHDRQKCIDAGCDDYASKPIDWQGLVDLVGRYARRDQPALSVPTRE